MWLQVLGSILRQPVLCHKLLHCWQTLQTKISKRGRKLIDYDVARHNFDTTSAKKVDQAKLAKVHTFLPACEVDECTRGFIPWLCLLQTVKMQFSSVKCFC